MVVLFRIRDLGPFCDLTFRIWSIRRRRAIHESYARIFEVVWVHLQHQVVLACDLVALLEQEGPVWGQDQVETINIVFSRLRRIFDIIFRNYKSHFNPVRKSMQSRKGHLQALYMCQGQKQHCQSIWCRQGWHLDEYPFCCRISLKIYYGMNMPKINFESCQCPMFGHWNSIGVSLFLGTTPRKLCFQILSQVRWKGFCH